MSNAPAATPGLDMSRFGTIFGQAGGEAPAPAAKREAATIWVNVGYLQPEKDAQGNDVLTFVSLPFGGIPIDTQKPSELKGNPQKVLRLNRENKLLEQVTNIGKSMEPGQEHILAFDSTNRMALQIRRVRVEVEASAVTDNADEFVLTLPTVGVATAPAGEPVEA